MGWMTRGLGGGVVTDDDGDLGVEHGRFLDGRPDVSCLGRVRSARVGRAGSNAILSRVINPGRTLYFYARQESCSHITIVAFLTGF